MTTFDKFMLAFAAIALAAGMLSCSRPTYPAVYITPAGSYVKQSRDSGIVYQSDRRGWKRVKSGKP